jgi:hypothetical protein
MKAVPKECRHDCRVCRPQRNGASNFQDGVFDRRGGRNDRMVGRYPPGRSPDRKLVILSRVKKAA